MWKTSSFCSVDGCVEVGTWDKASFSNPSGCCVEAGAWDKSTFSTTNGGCVEAGAWDKSSFSTTNGGCVEMGAWNKSSFSYSNGNCVEAEGTVKSSFSNYNGSCVEAEHAEHVIAVRDTKDRSVEPVVFSLGEWQEFIEDVKAGEYPLTSGLRGLLRRALRRDLYGIGHLVFNRGEWDAFVRGAQNLDENGRGEFDLSPALEAELATA